MIDNLLKVVTGAIDKVDPKIDIGFMTAGPGWSSYSGGNQPRWLKTMRATRVRPGGGFYVDYNPSDMLYKAYETARQCVLYEGKIADVQYELENFIYQKLDKAAQSVLNECTLALAAGCNGIAFNALNDTIRSMDDYEDLLAGIERMQPVWREFIRAADGLPLRGLWPAWNRHLAARREVDHNWFDNPGEYDFNHAVNLVGVGLPLAAGRETSCGTILTGRLAEIFSDRELREMLSGGAMIDGPTLEVLHRRRLGKLAGVKVGKTYDNGVWETLTDHPLNGPFARFPRHSHLVRPRAFLRACAHGNRRPATCPPDRLQRPRLRLRHRRL